MDITMFDFTLAICMVTVGIGMIVWFRRYLAANSARRMRGMMMRLGLDPKNAPSGDSDSQDMMKNLRNRCRKCPSEDLCERWLAGEAKGDNTFCPNAQIFDTFSGAA